MKLLLCFLAALLVVPAFAQTPSPTSNNAGTSDRMGMDDYRTSYQADLDRLGRDLDRLDRSVRNDMRADYTTYRQDYDRLRTDFGNSDADMSDPEAAMRMRQEYAQRYDDIAGNVYGAQLRSAPNRNAYFQTAMDRLDFYDNQIEAVRSGYSSMTDDARAERARDLISLRSQRDAYRNELYSARSSTRTNFDTARRQTTDTLTRYDGDFHSTRRGAMMRPMRSDSRGQNAGTSSM